MATAAPYGTVSHRIVQPKAPNCGCFLSLTTHRYAKRADVSTAVKSPQTNGVLAVGERGNRNRKEFVAAVGDAIIGKQGNPGAAINAEICPPDLTGGIVHVNS